MRLNNGDLVGGGYYLILWHRPCSCKLPRPYIPCCCPCLIPSDTLFCPLALFLWCFTPVVTCGKCHEFSISLVVLVCRLVYLLGLEL